MMRQAVDKYLDNALTKDYLRYKFTDKTHKIINKAKELIRCAKSVTITISYLKPGGPTHPSRRRVGTVLPDNYNLIDNVFPVGTYMYCRNPEDLPKGCTWEKMDEYHDYWRRLK